MKEQSDETNEIIKLDYELKITVLSNEYKLFPRRNFHSCASSVLSDFIYNVT